MKNKKIEPICQNCEYFYKKGCGYTTCNNKNYGRCSCPKFRYEEPKRGENDKKIMTTIPANTTSSHLLSKTPPRIVRHIKHKKGKTINRIKSNQPKPTSATLIYCCLRMISYNSSVISFHLPSVVEDISAFSF